MHVAPSRETSRTATVVLGGCRSASVTSGASSLGAHAGGNRNRGGAGGSESIIAESQVAYGTGCKAVDNGCGHAGASARLQCAQTPHVKQTQHAKGTRGHFAARTDITTCVCAVCTFFQQPNSVNDSNGQSGASACVASRSCPGGSSRVGVS